MSIAMSLVQGLWFLAHHHNWVLTRTFMGDPVAIMSLGDLAGIVPQDQSFHQLSSS